MYIDKNNYMELEDFKKFGVCAIFTKKNYGDIKSTEQEKIKKDFDLEKYHIVSGHQTHSDNIAVVEDLENLYFEDTDGFITSRDDVAIVTKYADCLPIYFVDDVKKVIGAVHSGWQGSFKEIGKKAIELMRENYGSHKEDIKIAFGIGISCQNYEVGQDFYEKFRAKFERAVVERSFVKKDNKYYFDNQLFNYLNFISLGIPKENIVTNDLDTYKGDFFSYRRERENKGRNGGIIYFERKKGFRNLSF